MSKVVSIISWIGRLDLGDNGTETRSGAFSIRVFGGET
jgi:hypothetical protein